MSGSWLRQVQELLNSFDSTDQWCNHAIKTILRRYGDTISIDFKRDSFLQFGMNTDVDADVETNIADLSDGVSRVPILSANLIDTLSTSDASFVGEILIEGYKIVDGDLFFVEQLATADGQNKVTLDTPLLLATSAENADETLFSDLSDEVFIYEDTAISGGVPDDEAKIHLIFEALHRQSLTAAAAFAGDEYGLITHFYGDLNKGMPPATTADILIRVQQFGTGQGRKPGGLKTELIRTVYSDGRNGFDLPMTPFFIVPKNSIIVMNAIASTNNVSLSGGFNVISGRVQ